MMQLIIHHLNVSRSSRILWLAEELGLDYSMIEHRRDTATMRAPASLGAVHPLGKAPTVEIDGQVMAESGAIVEYLCDRLGKLAPAPDDAERAAYLEWMHFAEGSAMMPVMLGILTRSMGPEAMGGVMAFFDPEIAKVLDYLEAAVKEREYLLASGFGAADILNHYVVAAAAWAGLTEDYPGLSAYRARLEARPAFVRAVAKGGSFFPG